MNLQNIPNRVYVFILILLCFITRIPQLISPNLLLDGDECILGLMAKHIAEGKELPVYFYGQNYGFSLPEAAFGAVSFLLFGVNAIALRVSLLLLWSFGIVFFFLSFLQLTTKKNALLITLLMILIPAWAIGSMKARGGYITAFTLTSIVFYCLFKAKESPTIITSIFIGVLTILIYLSRPFWIPGLLPVFVYIYARKSNIRGMLTLAASAIAVFLIFKICFHITNVSYKPDLLFYTNYFVSIKEIPRRIYYNVTGSYELDNNIPLGFFTRITAYIWDGILILLFFIQVYRFVTKKFLAWSHILCLSVVFTIAYIPMFTLSYGSRFLLPYTQFHILWLGIEVLDFIQNNSIKKGIGYLSIILYLFCCGALIEFKDFNFLPHLKDDKSEQQRFDEMTNYFKANDIRNVFSTDPLLQWQVMFYSKEAVICRWLDDVDRYPQYPKTVDKALDDGKTVSLLGMKDKMLGLDTLPDVMKALIPVGDRYFVYPNPSKDFLKSRGYEFKN